VKRYSPADSIAYHAAHHQNAFEMAMHIYRHLANGTESENGTDRCMDGRLMAPYRTVEEIIIGSYITDCAVVSRLV